MTVKNGILKVVVKPNSKKTEILSETEGVIKISVKASPEKGKANQEFVRFLSKHLKKNVKIIAGFKSREKVLKIY